MRTLPCALLAKAGAACAFALLTAAHGKPLLNDSGSTVCFDPASGAAIACLGTGQDGEFGRDVTSPEPKDGEAGFRFAKVCNNGLQGGVGSCPKKAGFGPAPEQWACTRDKNTGLLWQLNTTDGGQRDINTLYFFNGQIPGSIHDDAVNFIAAMNDQQLCHAADWRMPSLHELGTLAHYGIQSPALRMDPTFFPNTPLDAIPFWTTTTFSADGTYRWFLGFGSGGDSAGDARRANHVRLVSGEPLLKPSRFHARPDNNLILVDHLTGLEWRRCREGQSWDGISCSFDAVTATWAGALAIAAAAGEGWRLPSIAELVSTMFAPGRGPCSLVLSDFPYGPVWSNTPDVGGVGASGGAWVFNINSGCWPRQVIPTNEAGQVQLVRVRQM